MTQKTIKNQYEVELNEHIIKLCHKVELPLHYNYKGPKIYTNYQRIALIILYIRSKKSLIDFLQEFCETKWVSWLGLKEIPSKSVLNNWTKLFGLDFIRNLLSIQVKNETPSIMAIDATGIDSWKRSRHYEKRIRDFGHKDHVPYAKADILIDTDTRIIHDWVLRIKPRHDTLGATTIFQRFKQKNILILADRGYDSEPLHKEVVKQGNLLFAPVRNHKKNPGGYNRKRCAKGNDLYAKRNTVESVMHSIKSIKPELRSKLHYLKKREMGWTVIFYNIKKMININNIANLIFEYYFKNLFWI